MARNTIYLLILALVGPYLYDRYLAYWPMVANLPSRMKPIYTFRSHELKFQDRIRNCEDVVLDEGMGLAILSCDAGRDRWNTVMASFHPEKGIISGGLYLYDYSTSNLPDSDALKPLTLKNFDTTDFHPLGIDFDAATSTLYVVNHAQSGSAIEVFNLSVKSAIATHVQTFKHQLLHSPNAIQVLGKGKILFTNDHYIRASLSPFLSQVETWGGIPGGSVIYVDLADPLAAKTVAWVPFANGIVMLNQTTLAVASSSKPGVLFYTVTPQYDLQYKGFIRTPSTVDNISVDGKGKLLIAGHPFPPTLFTVAKNRWRCDLESEEADEKEACRCNAPSWTAEWSEGDGLRDLYKGFEICSSSSVVRDTGRGVGIISGLYERGIMVFKD
ncbi:calcium-dependent phosphotriesterase [Lindgomyces ingoldianus]|uniref:Calcium-dependent phosphotriesterase n=1 Tax=Lindgomyces ingoldianus TaxID=673940 RepID=A0ACB6RBE2_9PLEO|nr:calcium-dependent phosphotriesterase [Lindgomyces ingoldianus]KAF2476506.1 calcium-dependent phosphotriesterase [Lindgomyces ingoldianus]